LSQEKTWTIVGRAIVKVSFERTMRTEAGRTQDPNNSFRRERTVLVEKECRGDLVRGEAGCDLGLIK